MRRYWYSILLTGSIMILAMGKLPPDVLGVRTAMAKAEVSAMEMGEAETNTAEAESVGAAEAEAKAGATGAAEMEAGATSAPEMEAAETDAPETAAPQTTSQAPEVPSTVSPGTNETFSDTLFIGDSRTVGLFEYGDLGQAEVFANSGMSVFNLFQTQVTLKNGTKQSLDEVLSSNRYSSIYLMLGINELGYEEQSILRQYRAVVEQIRAKQPQASLILEANLHVTREKAAKSDIYNNRKIDALNKAIETIAEETGCRYLDVNSLFDDETGNLSANYSTDGSHILGKYYSVWVDWIRSSR
ncbi:GDSL-type esterase/lipase family protein [Enterocloster asparagiformis]|uniref:GDSL-type esterase/lipase family protein n=1 Tax=Enterocloster asparagiformis TaxID=333367 RepID=UPI002A82DFC3|nr:GDSL-type esterase/lipase family protein [Enterocloster asparagiformis]